jgi:hypothetical protein
MRIARTLGTDSFIWPEGTGTIESIPYDLAVAISHASMVLSWYENLMKHEIPPQWMWIFADELEEWFEEVEAERRSSSNIGDNTHLVDNEYER